MTTGTLVAIAAIVIFNILWRMAGREIARERGVSVAKGQLSIGLVLWLTVAGMIGVVLLIGKLIHGF